MPIGSIGPRHKNPFFLASGLDLCIRPNLAIILAVTGVALLGNYPRTLADHAGILVDQSRFNLGVQVGQVFAVVVRFSVCIELPRHFFVWAAAKIKKNSTRMAEEKLGSTFS